MKESERIYCLDAEIYLDCKDENQEGTAEMPGKLASGQRGRF